MIHVQKVCFSLNKLQLLHGKICSDQMSQICKIGCVRGSRGGPEMAESLKDNPCQLCKISDQLSIFSHGKACEYCRAPRPVPPT